MALTDKQKRFAVEYIVDLNATAAAVRAGYAKKSSAKSGWLCMSNAEVQTEIQKAMKARSTRTEVTADRVVKELATMAFVDPSAIMQKTPRGVKIVNTDELTEDQRRCILSLSETAEGSIKCRIADKIKALELLGRHLGIFVDRMEMTGQGGGPVRLQAMTDEELEQIAGGDDDDT